jgi:hypothetical protein
MVQASTGKIIAFPFLVDWLVGKVLIQDNRPGTTSIARIYYHCLKPANASRACRKSFLSPGN